MVGVSVTCSHCHLRKKPRRSAPPEMENSLCDFECPGYEQEPRVGSLWPGETSLQFGYPVGSDGTIERPDKQPCPHGEASYEECDECDAAADWQGTGGF